MYFFVGGDKSVAKMDWDINKQNTHIEKERKRERNS